MKKLVGFMATIAVIISMTSHEAMARELTVKEKAIIAKAVKRDLTDPESARFKWVPLAPGADPKTPPNIYCGVVNAKNRLGGYVGDRTFLAVIGWDKRKIAAALVMSIGSDENTPFVLSQCAEHGYSDFFSAE